MDLPELDKNVHEIASTNENDFISHSFLVLLNVHVRDEMMSFLHGETLSRRGQSRDM
jgi:hypothetical protein